MPLNTDDPARPGNLSDEEYRAEYERFVAEHPEANPPIPAGQYRMHEDGAE